MLDSLLRLIAALYESSLASILGGLAIFFGGAFFVVYKQTGETNVKEILISMVMGDPGVRAAQKEFWDRNPNLEFVRSYNQGSFQEVRVRGNVRSRRPLSRRRRSGPLHASPRSGLQKARNRPNKNCGAQREQKETNSGQDKSGPIISRSSAEMSGSDGK